MVKFMKLNKNIIICLSILSLVGCSSNQAPVSSANNPQAKIPTTVMTNAVFFPFNSAALPKDVNKLITLNASYLISHPDAVIQVQGNSSEIGTVSYNQSLAMQRAVVVRQALLKSGAKSNQVTIISFGNKKPAYPADSKGMQAKNQRADLVYTSQAPFQYKVNIVPTIDSATMN